MNRVRGLGSFRGPDIGQLDLGRVSLGSPDVFGTLGFALMGVGVVALGYFAFLIFPMGLSGAERRLRAANAKIRESSALAIDGTADFEEAAESAAGIVDTNCRLTAVVSPGVGRRLVTSCLAYKNAASEFTKRGCKFTPELEAKPKESKAEKERKAKKAEKVLKVLEEAEEEEKSE
ncbi:MAG: hypothetical protein ACREH5_03220 [Candidatus Omnitrophota bacterium]